MMPKDVNEMTQEELQADVLRLRDKMRDDALRCAWEIETARRAFERNPPDSLKKNILGR